MPETCVSVRLLSVGGREVYSGSGGGHVTAGSGDSAASPKTKCRKMGNSNSATRQPEMMRRVVLTRPAAEIDQAQLSVETVQLPKPRSGEVLIRVAAAPVNPSDYGKFKSTLAPDAPFTPMPMGNEGSGVVVASGGGMYANSLVGKAVGFNNLKKQGSWSEYVTASAMMSCFPLPPSLPAADGCSFFINPYTAYAILDTVRTRGAKGFVHTGAASQLGQMIAKHVASGACDLTVLHLVRREEQAQTLRALGAKHVLITAGETWKADLKRQVAELGLTIAFDCVAGEMTETLIDALPKSSTTFVYGRLSGESARVAPLDLIYFSKSLEGFLVAGQGKQAWINMNNPLSTVTKLHAAGKVVLPALGEGGWAQSTFDDTDLDAWHDDFLTMWRTAGFTNRKLRIRMNTSMAAATPPAEELA